MVEGLKSEGITHLAAVGYCFGGTSLISKDFIDNNNSLVHMTIGRYVFDLAFENIIKVSVVAHPSLLKAPDDLEVCIFFFFRSSLSLSSSSYSNLIHTYFLFCPSHFLLAMFVHPILKKNNFV